MLEHNDRELALNRMDEPKFSQKATMKEMVFARLLAQGEDLPIALDEAGLASDLTKAQCWSKGARLAKTVRVQERVLWYRELINRRFDVREDRVLGELAAIAFSDPLDFVDDKGEVLPLHKLPKHARAAVSTIDQERREDGTYYIRLRLVDKMKSLNQLVKIKNMEQSHQAATAPTIEIGFKKK